MFQGPKRVHEICIDQDEASGDIYAMRILDDTGAMIIDCNWRAPTQRHEPR